jgi:ketosteroid isomerase-like protein
MRTRPIVIAAAGGMAGDIEQVLRRKGQAAQWAVRRALDCDARIRDEGIRIGHRQFSLACGGCDGRGRVPYNAPGPNGAKHMADNAQMIIDLDRKRMQAMADTDIATLNTLLADDLIYTHSSARLDTKESLISNMQSGSTVYNAVEPSDVKAQDLGNAVVLTGVARIRVTSGGKPNAFAVRFTDVYANKSGKWQMVTWQSTRLAE